MSIDNIVEGLNQFFEETRKDVDMGHFVLRKSTDSHSVIKSQKIYMADVWFITPNKKIQVFGSMLTARGVTNAEDVINQDMLTTSFSKALLAYVNSQDFKDLCNGKYN